MSTVYQKDLDYPAAADRYHLVVAYACPFAQRTIIVRELMGLEDVISMTRTSDIKTEKIWDFSNYENHEDPVLGIAYLSEAYQNTDPDYEGPFSVPALIDKTTGQVVNQESIDISVDFATRFKELGNPKVEDLDLYPESKKVEIDQWFDVIGKSIIGAPHRAGTAENQEDFDAASDEIYKTLVKIDELLKHQDYLVGDQLTLADVFLYTPVVRMDILFPNVYGLNAYSLKDFPNLFAYTKKLHQKSAFKNSTDFEGIKKGAFLGKNGSGVFTVRQAVPHGPNMSYLDE